MKLEHALAVVGLFAASDQSRLGRPNADEVVTGRGLLTLGEERAGLDVFPSVSILFSTLTSYQIIDTSFPHQCDEGNVVNFVLHVIKFVQEAT